MEQNEERLIAAVGCLLLLQPQNTVDDDDDELYFTKYLMCHTALHSKVNEIRLMYLSVGNGTFKTVVQVLQR